MIALVSGSSTEQSSDPGRKRSWSTCVKPGRLLVAAGLVLAAQAGTAQAGSPPRFARVIAFGDSLSDAGTYGWRFTTNPGLTFAQDIANAFGQNSKPNERLDHYALAYRGHAADRHAGGLNYAEGGARANHPYSTVSAAPEAVPISAAIQLDHFLREKGPFQSNDLITLFVGTNDVALDYDPAMDAGLAARLRAGRPPPPGKMAAETARVQAAADDVSRIAAKAMAHGARHLVVLKLIDMGQMPWFRTVGARRFASRLSRIFNLELSAKLPRDRRLLVIDTDLFMNRLISRRAEYGFSHGANEDACKLDDQDSCFPNTFKSRDADQTYIFAASEHFTTHTHRLLADYIVSKIRMRWPSS